MSQNDTSHQWTLGERFNQVYPHHASISALWNLEWKRACSVKTYPFHDGNLADFTPIFDKLIEKGINDGYSAEYTREFISKAEQLGSEAEAAVSAGKPVAVIIELYLRSCTVYRLARFPYISGPDKTAAYEAQKKTYMKAAALFDPPIRDVSIPHVAGTAEEGTSIPVYLRVPKGPERSYPVVVVMGGLDGHRPDFTMLFEELTVRRGWATVLVDIPGTADCPAVRRDASGADRLWTSVLSWIAEQDMFDMQKVVAWGLSAGGYYGIRAAHTHASSLLGAVGQGAGTHHFFSRAWLEKGQWHEYPWTYLPALREKFGYGSVEEFLSMAQRDLSLLGDGTLDKPCCRLLLINGKDDGLMPIEDSSMVLEYGSPKEARFFQGATHMGKRRAVGVVLNWMESVMKTGGQ